MPEEEVLSQQGGELSPEQFTSGQGSIEAPPPSEPGPGQPPPAGQPPELAPITIRDYVSQTLGFNLPPEVTDDAGVLAALVRRAAQAEQYQAQLQQQSMYAQLGQQLAPQADRINQFLQQPQQQQAARKPWEPPPFDKRWAQLVTRDEGTGIYLAKPGVPVEIAKAVNDYAEWQDAYHSNPAAVLQNWGQQMREDIRNELRQEFSEQLQADRMQQAVYGIAQQNASWAYAKNDQGALIPDPYNGGYALSPLGQQYVGLVKALGDQGVASPIARDQLARQLLAPQIQAFQAQSQPPTAQQQAQQRQQQAARGQRSGANRNPLAALNAIEQRQTPDAEAAQGDGRGLTFRDRLRRDMRQAGLTDADLQDPGSFTAGA